MLMGSDWTHLGGCARPASLVNDLGRDGYRDDDCGHGFRDDGVAFISPRT